MHGVCGHAEPPELAEPHELVEPASLPVGTAQIEAGSVGEQAEAASGEAASVGKQPWLAGLSVMPLAASSATMSCPCFRAAAEPRNLEQL